MRALCNNSVFGARWQAERDTALNRYETTIQSAFAASPTGALHKLNHPAHFDVMHVATARRSDILRPAGWPVLMAVPDSL